MGLFDDLLDWASDKSPIDNALYLLNSHSNSPSPFKNSEAQFEFDRGANIRQLRQRLDRAGIHNWKYEARNTVTICVAQADEERASQVLGG